MKNNWTVNILFGIVILLQPWWMRALPMSNNSLSEWGLLGTMLLTIVLLRILAQKEQPAQHQHWKKWAVVMIAACYSYVFIKNSDWSAMELLSYGVMVGYCLGYVIREGSKFLKETSD